MSPLPDHIVGVCASAITERQACPGYRLLIEDTCVATLPYAEGGTCAAKSIQRKCQDRDLLCPALVRGDKGGGGGEGSVNNGLESPSMLCHVTPPPPPFPSFQCKYILNWYCGLSDFDASLVSGEGLAPGSIVPPDKAAAAAANAASGAGVDDGGGKSGALGAASSLAGRFGN